jgi:hypothetical protein
MAGDFTRVALESRSSTSLFAMTITGTGLQENDLATLAADWILDQWDAGVDAPEIRRRSAALEARAVTPLEVECLQAACVKAFWEIGELLPQQAQRLRALLDDGASLAGWAAFGGAAAARKRKALLERLIAQVATPKAKLRGRKPTSLIRRKLFSEGDCLTITLASQSWHALVVRVYEKRGRCEYVITPMQAVQRSTQRGFEEGQVVGHWIGMPNGRIFGFDGAWFDHRVLVRDGLPFTTVAHVDLDPTRCTLGSYSGAIAVADLPKRFAQISARPGGYGLEVPLANVLRQAA